MGIENVGFSTSRTTSNSQYGLRMYDGAPPQEAYVKWRTLSDTTWNAIFDISVSWRGVPKGVTGTGDNGYAPWSTFRYSNIPASQCNPVQTPGSDGWQWSYPLASLGVIEDGHVDPDGKTIGSLVAPDGWAYDDRKYDALNFQVHIKSRYPEGMVDHMGRTESLRADADSLWVGYFPDYTLTGAYFTLKGFTIEYSAPGWTRLDDRWALESLKQGGEELKVYNDYYSTVEEIGKLPVPPDALKRMPEAGQTAYVQVHMNAGFRDIGMDFGMVQGYVTVQDKSVCNTPSITVQSATADAIVAKVTDSGDKGTPFDEAVVKLVDSPYGADTQTVAPGGTVTIVLPPLGVPLRLQAYGYSDEAVSGMAYADIAAIPAQDGLSVRSLDGSEGVELRYNVSEDWSFEAEMETVKFAGRERDSVAYGTGGTVTGTLECDIVDSTSYGAKGQSRADFERLAFAGTCVVRGDDGERRMVAVESVGESWDTVRLRKTMKISAREV